MKKELTDKEYIVRWKKDPVLFIQEVFHIKLDNWQKNVAYSFRDNPRTVTIASKGVGKSAIAAWLAWWAMCCHDDANVFMTSITEKNLKDGLWKEFATWHSRSEFLKKHYEVHGEQAYMKGKKLTHFARIVNWNVSSEDEQSSAVAGKHAEHIFFFTDEVGSYPMSIIEGVDAIHSGSPIVSRVLAIGNPENRTGALFQIVTKFKHLWNIFKVTADPDDPDRTSRVSKELVREKIAAYGRDHPFVMINYLGEFPLEGTYELVGQPDVDRALKREHFGRNISNVILGVDPSRFGGDKTIMWARQGAELLGRKEIVRSDTQNIVSGVFEMIEKYKVTKVAFDGGGGYAAGAVDALLMSNVRVVEVQFNSQARNPERYGNVRAEIWDKMANWIKTRAVLDKNAHSKLIEEVLQCSMKSEVIRKNGKAMMLESKDDLKKRLGRSPDDADALALTFYFPEVMSDEQRKLIGDNLGFNDMIDHDPYSDENIGV